MKYNIKLLSKEECMEYVQNYKDKIDLDDKNKYKSVDYIIRCEKNNGEYYDLYTNGIFYTFYEAELIYIPHLAIIKWIADKAVKEMQIKFEGV